jgi:hypothetical protein
MSRVLSSLRQLIPAAAWKRVKNSFLFVRHRSCAANVYHCTVYRTGSQWIRGILSDWRVIRYGGLLPEFHPQRIYGTAERPDLTLSRPFPFAEPFAPGQVVTLYASYDNYLRLSKPASYRTFFVFRDPRDIIVSHYFSALRGARLVRSDPHSRELASAEDGISLVIDELEHMGLFSSLESWTAVSAVDEHVRLVRFEDLIGPEGFDAFWDLMAHCDIAIPGAVLCRVLQDHSFSSLSGGRQPGEEDISSHYRKGVAGDWRNHFTDQHLEKFVEVAGDLVALSGYQW